MNVKTKRVYLLAQLAAAGFQNASRRRELQVRTIFDQDDDGQRFERLLKAGVEEWTGDTVSWSEGLKMIEPGQRVDVEVAERNEMRELLDIVTVTCPTDAEHNERLCEEHREKVRKFNASIDRLSRC